MEIDESCNALLVSAFPDGMLLVGHGVPDNWVQLHENPKLRGKTMTILRNLCADFLHWRVEIYDGETLHEDDDELNDESVPE